MTRDRGPVALVPTSLVESSATDLEIRVFLNLSTLIVRDGVKIGAAELAEMLDLPEVLVLAAIESLVERGYVIHGGGGWLHLEVYA